MSKLAKANPKAVLIIDDEPLYLEWLQEYIESRGYRVDWAITVDDGLNQTEIGKYKALIVDLHIPASAALEPQLKQRGAVYEQYPGLLAAHVARDRGYNSSEVVLYSGHDVRAANAVAEQLGCKYIDKEQPGEFKRLIKAMLPKVS